jgi:hypothetical protein
LLAKLIPAFVDKECHAVSVSDPYSRIPGSRLEPLLFLPSTSSIVEVEWTPFQTYYLSEILVALGI